MIRSALWLLVLVLCLLGFSAKAAAQDDCASPAIALFGEVTPNAAYHFVEQMIQYDSTTCKSPILVYIDGHGGDVQAGGAIIDAMHLSHRPITTILVANASSMDAIIFLAGDHRVMWPHALLMLHRLSIQYEGNPDQISSEEAAWKRIEKNYEEPIAKKIGISFEEYQRRCNAAIWMLPEDAVAMHLADEIAKAEH